MKQYVVLLQDFQFTVSGSEMPSSDYLSHRILDENIALGSDEDDIDVINIVN